MWDISNMNTVGRKNVLLMGTSRIHYLKMIYGDLADNELVDLYLKIFHRKKRNLPEYKKIWHFLKPSGYTYSKKKVLNALMNYSFTHFSDYEKWASTIFEGNVIVFTSEHRFKVFHNPSVVDLLEVRGKSQTIAEWTSELYFYKGDLMRYRADRLEGFVSEVRYLTDKGYEWYKEYGEYIPYHEYNKFTVSIPENDVFRS